MIDSTHKEFNDFDIKIILQKVDKKFNVINAFPNVHLLESASLTFYFSHNGVLFCERIVYSEFLKVYGRPSIDVFVNKINTTLEESLFLLEPITHNNKVRPFIISDITSQIITHFLHCVKHIHRSKIQTINLKQFLLNKMTNECENMLSEGSTPVDIFDFLYKSVGIDQKTLFNTLAKLSIKPKRIQSSF